MSFPPSLATPLRAWRLDRLARAGTWDSGTGAFNFGGRWNPKGTHAVYCALDAATAIVEVAVHTGFDALDMTPHAFTVLEIPNPKHVHVVKPDDVPNPAWLLPCSHSAGQQQFGGKLLQAHDFVALPSAVSRHSWNLVFNPERAAGKYRMVTQERFALDPRLNPPAG